MPVRIGFIGTGGIAGAHFNNLEQIPDAKVVALADISQERAEKAAQRFGGVAYTDAKRMLETETLDAVYVCVPPHAHTSVEVLAAKMGLALFVEKPLANNMKTAEKVAAAIAASGVITAVGYHFRYHEATAQVKTLLGVKGAAQPAMLYGRWLGGFPGVPWWRNYAQSGGQLVEQATHVVDLMRYLAGDIVKVYCAASLLEMNKVYPDATSPDVTALTLEFASGAVGYASTASLLGGVGETGVDVFVKDGRYDVLGNTLKVITASEQHTYTYRNNPYLDEDKAFIKAVKTKKPAGIKSDYFDALKTLRVTLAANQSAETGKPVKV